MNIVLLFNWNAYADAGNYWYRIRDAVFATDLIQNSERHMKLSIGDVLAGLHPRENAELVFQNLFLESEWSIVDDQRLKFGFPCIFGMVFENMPIGLATKLHGKLQSEVGYIGAISVHFEFGPHLVRYRSQLSLTYRLRGKMLRSFYSMGEEDGKDEWEIESMQKLGYEDVGFEDSGAKRTILDDYDTLTHFKRVAAFRKLVSPRLANGADDAYELTMLLEDLSPKLFDSLGAAAKSLSDAETAEDVAQVALSGRRYLEQLADTLYPASKKTKNGRVLNKAAYKNRLWAYAEEHAGSNEGTFQIIGKEVDRLTDLLNNGLHADRTKVELEILLADLATLTAKFLSLNPNSLQNGYAPYATSIRNFWLDVFERLE